MYVPFSPQQPLQQENDTSRASKNIQLIYKVFVACCLFGILTSIISIVATSFLLEQISTECQYRTIPSVQLVSVVLQGLFYVLLINQLTNNSRKFVYGGAVLVLITKLVVFFLLMANRRINWENCYITQSQISGQITSNILQAIIVGMFVYGFNLVKDLTDQKLQGMNKTLRYFLTS